MSPRFTSGNPVIVVVIAVALCSLWPVLRGIAAEQGTSAPQSAPAPPPFAGIPVSEIATKAAQVTNFLQTLSAHSAPSHAVEVIKAKLPDLRQDNDREIAETTEMLRTTPTLGALQTKQKLWHGRELLTAGWLKTLTERAIQLRESLHHLDEARKTWTATREAAQASNAPDLILQQVDAVIGSLDGARIPLEAQQGDVLDLQAAVAREVARCESCLTQVTQAQEMAVDSLLTRDGPPIWSADLWGEAGKTLPVNVRRVIAGCWGDIQQYVWSPSRVILLHAGLFLATALLFGAAGQRAHRWAGTEESVSSSITVFDRPWSAAYLVSLIYTTGPHSPTPPTVQGLFSVAAVLPMIRLITPLGPRGILAGYITGVLFALEVIRQTAAGTPLLEQSFLVIELLTGVVVLAWAQVRGHIEPIHAHVERTALGRTVPTVHGLILLALALGLFAGVLGAMRLARLLASTVLGIGFLALLLYGGLRILTALVAFSLDAWPLRTLLSVQHHRDLLVRRAYRFLVWLTIGTGLTRLLDHLGLLQPALALGEAILTARLERGSIGISLGGILEFLLTIWVAYLLSAFIRFALQEDVYPRLGISVGISYAASSLLNYIILALGVAVGLGIVGVDFTRVTVMAGALGVGIGFGLQGVVNNFVSGLILLFERPIHVGDNIEVGSLTGEVRRIGIRASTIRTRKGAEIIIPNAQLVTDKVTNWTLSDRLRRIDLPVGVNYGAVPKEVIEVLEKVARAHPRVLRNPAPHGLFVGFGDSSINFELRTWTDEFVDWSRIRSELAIAIHDAVQEAGWSFPFPQHEVRLLNPPKTEEPAGANSSPLKKRD
jgi:potassium-dependent mechanosensitive channel